MTKKRRRLPTVNILADLILSLRDPSPASVKRKPRPVTGQSAKNATAKGKSTA
jgi:hypothetical protein